MMAVTEVFNINNIIQNNGEKKSSQTVKKETKTTQYKFY